MTRPRRHRTPPSLIKLSSFIRNIQIAILVSCLFFVCSQETGPRGQVDRAPAWSITLGSWFSDCEGATSRTFVVGSSRSTPTETIATISSKHRDTFASIKWYQISRLLDVILQFFVD